MFIVRVVVNGVGGSAAVLASENYSISITLTKMLDSFNRRLDSVHKFVIVASFAHRGALQKFWVSLQLLLELNLGSVLHTRDYSRHEIDVLESVFVGLVQGESRSFGLACERHESSRPPFNRLLVLK
jgi:hypothetical protein